MQGNYELIWLLTSWNPHPKVEALRVRLLASTAHQADQKAKAREQYPYSRRPVHRKYRKTVRKIKTKVPLAFLGNHDANKHKNFRDRERKKMDCLHNILTGF